MLPLSSKPKIWWFHVVVVVVVVVFFCGVQQRNAWKFTLHVQHEHFPFLTNNILALWRCRSHTRRLCFAGFDFRVNYLHNREVERPCN